MTVIIFLLLCTHVASEECKYGESISHVLDSLHNDSSKDACRLLLRGCFNGQEENLSSQMIKCYLKHETKFWKEPYCPERKPLTWLFKGIFGSFCEPKKLGFVKSIVTDICAEACNELAKTSTKEYYAYSKNFHMVVKQKIENDYVVFLKEAEKGLSDHELLENLLTRFCYDGAECDLLTLLWKISDCQTFIVFYIASILAACVIIRGTYTRITVGILIAGFAVFEYCCTLFGFVVEGGVCCSAIRHIEILVIFAICYEQDRMERWLNRMLFLCRLKLFRLRLVRSVRHGSLIMARRNQQPH